MSRTRWQRKAPDFYLTANDTSPAIAYQLLDGNGAAVSLTGAAVEFHMWGPGAAAAKINAAATITDAALGKVSYTFTAPNTDTPGDYLARWQVTFSGGAIQSFPNGDLLKVRVKDDIAA
jgi:phage baseplate assembly protein gpV